MHHRPRSQRGFTLIELVVVMAIAALLAAIAYPAYQEQVRKSRRADAMSVLAEATQFLERFAALNMRYDQDAAGVAVALPAALAQAPKDGATKYYEVSIEAVDQDSYTLRAEPTGTQADDACGVFTVDHLGVRTAERDDCWRR